MERLTEEQLALARKNVQSRLRGWLARCLVDEDVLRAARQRILRYAACVITFAVLIAVLGTVALAAAYGIYPGLLAHVPLAFLVANAFGWFLLIFSALIFAATTQFMRKEWRRLPYAKLDTHEGIETLLADIMKVNEAGVRKLELMIIHIETAFTDVGIVVSILRKVAAEPGFPRIRLRDTIRFWISTNRAEQERRFGWMVDVKAARHSRKK